MFIVVMQHPQLTPSPPLPSVYTKFDLSYIFGASREGVGCMWQCGTAESVEKSNHTTPAPPQHLRSTIDNAPSILIISITILDICYGVGTMQATSAPTRSTTCSCCSGMTLCTCRISTVPPTTPYTSPTQPSPTRILIHYHSRLNVI